MMTFARRARPSAAVCAAGVALALATSGSNVAPAAQKDPPKPPAGRKIDLAGASVCQRCHNEADPKSVAEYKQTLGFEFVRLWENRVWGDHDLHSTAYKNLLTRDSDEVKAGAEKPNLLAQQMETNLRGQKGPGYLVTKDPACLACHASTKHRIRDEPPEKWTAESFETSEGVGCEMCHGHGSAYRDKHQESRLAKGGPPGAVRVVDWREWDPKVKGEWGMVNLRDPAVATARCASCHIGNKDEGRFVTHEMFAAGHPPLPPLDLLAFAREQPRHWGWPTEMPYFTGLAQRDAKKAMDIFHFRGGESFVTRRFAESAVATLHATAVSAGQLAASAKPEGGLDFAAFDCFACHHDLKYPSDRQARGYLGRPGRPLFRPAPFALAGVVVEHAASLPDGEALKASLKALAEVERQLADAFTRRSLGDPELVVKASRALRDWSTDTLAKLAKVRYDAKAAHGLLLAVSKAATDAKTPVADPEVAQAFAWAIETLVLELQDASEKQPTPATPPKVLAQLHKELEGVVVTRLRPKAPFYFEQRADGKAVPNLEPVADRIDARMKTIYGFRGSTFREVIGKLQPDFPKPK